MTRDGALPVWCYWEGPRPTWIERCQATIARHAANPRMLDWAAFDALWDQDRDIDLHPLYVAHRADFIRAFLLAYHGGLWIDSDCVVMRPLDEVVALLDGDSFLAQRERQGQFSNGFIAASPGSTLARQFYGRVRDTLRSGAARGWTSLGADPLGVVLSGAPVGLRELDCRTIQPVCWSQPAEFFTVRSPGDHASHFDADALTYMLSNNAVQTHLRDHPGLELMTEGSFFRYLLARSGVSTTVGEAQDEAEERRAVWERLHRESLAGSGESLSGPGSSLAQTAVVRARLDGLPGRLGATTMLDAPCGDHYWLSHVELTAEYVGVDVVPDLIERNRRRYPKRQFLLADLVKDGLPRADLVLCRDALVHCSFRDALAILRNFRQSGAEWLLTTTFPGRDDNHDIVTGDWRPLNLELPPFRFPPPDELIVERCSEGDGRYRDKSLGLWRFADLGLEDRDGQG